MAHLYEVKHSNGNSYDVTTDDHHDDHSHESFKKILSDIIKNSTSGAIGSVIGGTIVHFAYKGRK